MTNADKFKNIFGLYATELWSMPEKDFLKWLNSEVMNCSEIPNSSDCISRQSAIDAIHEDADWLASQGSDWQVERMERDKSILRSLPSAEPERKRGEWIDHSDEGYVECPFCYSATNCDGNKDELHYCFSCGADMREGDSDDER